MRKVLVLIKDYIETLKYCFSLAWKSSAYYTICRLVAKIIIPLDVLFATFIAKYITNELIITVNENNGFTNGLLIATFLLLLSSIFALLSNQLMTYSTTIHNDILTKDIEMLIINKSLASDLEMFDNPEYYNKFTLSQRDSQALSSIIWTLIDFTSQIFIVLSIVAVFCGVNAFYGFLIVGAAIPAAISMRKYTKVIYGISVEQVNDERKKHYYSLVSTNRDFAQTIRLYNLSDFIKKRYMSLWTSMFLAKKRVIKRKTVFIGFFQFIPEILIVIITINIISDIVNSNLTVGDYALLTGLLTQLYDAVMGAVNSAMSIYDNKLKIDNILSFKDIPQRIKNGTEILENIETIEFKDVYFKYPQTSQDIFTGLSFKINKGEKVALVGVNGAGKSTLLKLLLRFYDVDNGSILINGTNIKRYDLLSLRSNFDTYFQNSVNFAFTIRDNIVLNNRTDHPVSDEEIIKSIERVHGGDVLKMASLGLDTYLSKAFDDDGIELSGGQHQKIALSRVLYNNRKVLLLDEPSSSLDPEAENDFFVTIEKYCLKNTVIFTSHRFTNLSLADWILVLEDGKILESGSKETLLELNGRFAQLYKLQKEKYG